MSSLALQINPNDPMFWVMVVVAVSFLVIADIDDLHRGIREPRSQIGKPA